MYEKYFSEHTSVVILPPNSVIVVDSGSYHRKKNGFLRNCDGKEKLKNGLERKYLSWLELAEGCDEQCR
jgi:hypothetical protein